MTNTEEVKKTEVSEQWEKFMGEALPTDDPYFVNCEKWRKAFADIQEQIFEAAWKSGYERALKIHNWEIINAPLFRDLAQERLLTLREIFKQPTASQEIKDLVWNRVHS